VARLVMAGSLEEPTPDRAWPTPHSPYAAAKLGAGAYARMCHALYGTPVVWPRLFMVYGPAQPDVRKLVPYVTTSLLHDESPELSSGSRPVDWIYIDDVVDALLAAAVADGVEGRTFDVGSGRLVPIRHVVEEIARLCDAKVAPHFGTVPERPLEQVRVADVAPTAAYLGWRAQTPLEEGLRKTVDWYRRHDGASRARARGVVL
jgi:nucleoside-diphosphate-sugar epimerase